MRIKNNNEWRWRHMYFLCFFLFREICLKLNKLISISFPGTSHCFTFPPGTMDAYSRLHCGRHCPSTICVHISMTATFHCMRYILGFCTFCSDVDHGDIKRRFHYATTFVHIETALFCCNSIHDSNKT